MKKITLESLIYKNYLKTSFTSILFIELVLIIIYFTVSSSIIEKSMNLVLKNIKDNTYELVKEKSKQVDNKIFEIEMLAKILQKEHQHFFENKEEYPLNNNSTFDFAQNGMYYKVNDDGGSSVVVSKDTYISDDLKTELNQSQTFDFTFKTLITHDPDIAAIYYNSHKNYTRYYPFLEKSYNIFPINLDMKNYNFYYLADEKHNPKREVVLTDIYLDPAKKGWLLSAIIPIYKNNVLEGVSAIDISLKNFINNFLDINLPDNGKTFLINNKGKIIAMPREVESILNLKEVKDYEYKENETIDSTIYKSNKFSMINYPDKSISDNFIKIVQDKPYSHYFGIDNKKYLLFTSKIEKTSWYVISLIKEDEVLKDIKELKNYYDRLGILIILLILLFYSIFFFFLQKKAKLFVLQINNPLLKIIAMTKNLGKNRNIGNLESSNILEIDKLNENFNNLINELDIRTNELINEEAKRVYHEKLANIDSLTGAFNRRYLEDFSREYTKLLKRENKNLSLLIIDLDDFKNINDTYGHKIGDTVLKALVDITKDVVRESDLIVRFGGDEFLVLLPNTNEANAKMVASKILNAIKEYSKNKEFIFTVSIGVSEYTSADDSIEEMIKRADTNLYEAKKTGKNRVF